MKTNGMGTVGIFPNSLLYPTQTRQVSTAPRSIPETTMVAVEGQAGDDQGNVSLYSRLEGWLLLLFNNDPIFPPNYFPVMQLPCLDTRGKEGGGLTSGLVYM